MRLTSPSERFPALPSVSIDVPDTWAPDDTPSSVITAFDTASPSHFRVNAIVAIERVAAGPSLIQIAARFAEVANDDFPGYVVHGEELVDGPGVPRFLRLHGYQPDGVAFPIFQAQCLVLVPMGSSPSTADAGDGVEDLVQLHATCSGDVADRYGTVFRAIIDSLDIDGA